MIGAEQRTEGDLYQGLLYFATIMNGCSSYLYRNAPIHRFINTINNEADKEKTFNMIKIIKTINFNAWVVMINSYWTTLHPMHNYRAVQVRFILAIVQIYLYYLYVNCALAIEKLSKL